MPARLDSPSDAASALPMRKIAQRLSCVHQLPPQIGCVGAQLQAGVDWRGDRELGALRARLAPVDQAEYYGAEIHQVRIGIAKHGQLAAQLATQKIIFDTDVVASAELGFQQRIANHFVRQGVKRRRLESAPPIRLESGALAGDLIADSYARRIDRMEIGGLI